MENVRLKIINSHYEILDVIDRNIGTLVNFDYMPGYSIYPGKMLDADFSDDVLDDKEFVNNNWVKILAGKGYINRYIWMYPHNGKDEIKKFKGKNGSCEIYNIKFNGQAKLAYKYITVDSNFFGSKIPFNWSPESRIELFKKILDSITPRNIMLVVSKSKNLVNYDVENFLVDMKREITKRASIEELQ